VVISAASLLLEREVEMYPLAFFLGPMEMCIVGGIALLLFGSRLPGAMRSLGQSVTEFKKGVRDGENEDKPESPTQITDKKDSDK
jgi:sec-independent protein translocase protein TatA